MAQSVHTGVAGVPGVAGVGMTSRARSRHEPRRARRADARPPGPGRATASYLLRRNVAVNSATATIPARQFPITAIMMFPVMLPAPRRVQKMAKNEKATTRPE